MPKITTTNRKMLRRILSNQMLILEALSALNKESASGGYYMRDRLNLCAHDTNTFLAETKTSGD